MTEWTSVLVIGFIMFGVFLGATAGMMYRLHQYLNIRVELETVKRERDAAIKSLNILIQGGSEAKPGDAEVTKPPMGIVKKRKSTGFTAKGGYSSGSVDRDQLKPPPPEVCTPRPATDDLKDFPD